MLHTHFTQSYHSRPRIASTPDTKYTHSYLTSILCLWFFSSLSPHPSHLSQEPQPHLLCKHPLFPSL